MPDLLRGFFLMWQGRSRPEVRECVSWNALCPCGQGDAEWVQVAVPMLVYSSLICECGECTWLSSGGEDPL